MDEADQGSASEAFHTGLALAKWQASNRAGLPSLATCTDCSDDIPTKRQALGGVIRCISCQTLNDEKERQKGNCYGR